MRIAFAVLGILILAPSIVSAEESATTNASPPATTVEATPQPGSLLQPVNAAFVLSPDIVKAAVARGEYLAKKGKKWADVLSDFRETPKWVRGKGGKAASSRVWCLSLGATPVIALSYNAATRYEANPVSEKIRREGVTVPTIDFQVWLESKPKIGRWKWSKSRNADEDDVRATKFVLSDDKGNNFEAQPGATVGDDASGVMHFSGTAVVPHSSETTSQSSATASAYGSNGAWASGSGTAYGTSRTTWNEYHPWTADRPYYASRYFVSFSNFDDNGRPIIGPDVRKITLRIITPNGEQDVQFDLKAPKVK